jgi:hypothetical protein
VADAFCDRPFTRQEDEWHEDTLAGLRERVYRLARDAGAPHLIAMMDQVDAKVRDYRDVILF